MDVDDWMNERRIELGMRWSDLAEAAGITREALRQIRRGGPARLRTERNLEQALRWEPGGLEAIRQGGEPTPAAAPENTLAPGLMDAWQAIKEVRGAGVADRWLREAMDAIAEVARREQTTDTPVGDAM